jgi:uncharacterized protein YndB with AHSA1/START domain
MTASFTASAKVPIPPEDAWALWTDAGRYPQWQGGVRAVRDVTGPIDRAGATYVLNHGPGMKRHVTVTDAQVPSRYVLRQQGMGVTDQTTVLFEPVVDGTRVSVSVVFEFGRILGALSRLQPRGSITRELSRELERFAAFAVRTLALPDEGQLLTVDSNAGFRVIKVLAIDDENAHVAVLPGAATERPADLEPFLDGESRLADPLSLRPLQPSIRRSSSLVVTGQPLFALDGGVGVPHVALTIGALTDALPEPAGSFQVFEEEAAEVDSWQAAGGPVLGRDLHATVVPIVSVKQDAAYAPVKILRLERHAVHIRMYSDRWQIPPDHIDPWRLRMDRFDAPMPGIGHMPLSLSAFGSWDPAFERLAMLSHEELGGYEEWRQAEGGVFG